MKTISILIVSCLLWLYPIAQGKPASSGHLKTVSPGKHRYTIAVDGDIREYYVHVPTGYNNIDSLPVVFMLHGSGGNGEKFYKISGWTEQGDSANIITVFPSSWKYDCVIDDSLKKYNTEKWTSYDLVLCNNVKQRDDIKFLSTVLDDVKAKFYVKEKNVYMVGFSNGGEMAARCAIELSDRLAAVVACAGSIPPDTTLTPLRMLPVLVQMGTNDSNIMAKVGATSPFTLNIPALLSSYPFIQSIINAFINSFGLKKEYTILGNPGQYDMALYKGKSGDKNNICNFVMVKGLEHEYPNGINHPLKGAKIHWEWMKRFSLP